MDTSADTLDYYLLGHRWGKIEAFVRPDDYIIIQCISTNSPTNVYDAKISLSEEKLISERSYIPDENRSRFLNPKDDNPAKLRPNLKGMLGELPEDVKNLVEKILVD